MKTHLLLCMLALCGSINAQTQQESELRQRIGEKFDQVAKGRTNVGRVKIDSILETKKTITVYVTGNFPYLLAPEPIGGYYGCPMQFKVAEGNEWFVEEDGNIYDSEKTILVKAGSLYKGEPSDISFDVYQVFLCAFTYSLWLPEEQLVTFSERLQDIEWLAFAEPAMPYVKTDDRARTGGIRFKS